LKQASFVGASALLLAVGVAGCRDANGPYDALRGRYVLVSVDAKPLPVLLNDYSTAQFYLVGDTLRFDGLGTVAETNVIREDVAATGGSELHREQNSFDYVLSGDSVHFVFDCPPFAGCIAPPVGSILPGGTLIMVDRTTEGLANVRRYTPLH
jgi:hypothetical protein